jgi:hypothetical protein
MKVPLCSLPFGFVIVARLMARKHRVHREDQTIIIIKIISIEVIIVRPISISPLYDKNKLDVVNLTHVKKYIPHFNNIIEVKTKTYKIEYYIFTANYSLNGSRRPHR